MTRYKSGWDTLTLRPDYFRFAIAGDGYRIEVELYNEKSVMATIMYASDLYKNSFITLGRVDVEMTGNIENDFAELENGVRNCIERNSNRMLSMAIEFDKSGVPNGLAEIYYQNNEPSNIDTKSLIASKVLQKLRSRSLRR